MAERPVVQIWVCDPEEAFHRMMIARCEAEWVDHEHEMCIEDAATLHEREPLLFEERAETDPHWPPPELDPYEMIEPELLDDDGSKAAEGGRE